MSPELIATILGVIVLMAGAAGLRFSDKATQKEGVVSIALMVTGMVAILAGSSVVWWRFFATAYS